MPSQIEEKAEFQSILLALIERLSELFAYTSESTNEAEPGMGLTYPEIAAQFERPEAFLNTLLDVIRAVFTPGLGNMMLNGNPDFLLDAIPNPPSTLHYASETSDPGEPLSDFWGRAIAPYIQIPGPEQDHGLIVVLSTHTEDLRTSLVEQLGDIISFGLSPPEAINQIAADLSDDAQKPVVNAHAAFCVDSSLKNRFRISVWLFTPDHSSASTTIH